jgi:hypothetical protein
MRSFWNEPFLWIHLSGLAVVPIFLGITWLGLAIGEPIPFYWLELALIAFVGIIPIFLMQWQRPWNIFNILFLALKPEAMTREQLCLLRLFKSLKIRSLSVIAAPLMLLVLWIVYQFAPLAAIAVAPLPQIRLLGLAIATLAFLLANLFFQVSLSVLAVLFTSEAQFSATEPYSTETVGKDFTVVGFKLGKILPTLSN